MKTLLITDSHGIDPSALIENSVKFDGIEKLAVLGDLDTPPILRVIQEQVAKHKLRFIYTPGNHEYHYVKRYGISGNQMIKSAGDYAHEWENAAREKQFVLNAIASKTGNMGLVVRKKEIAYAHASLVDLDRLDPDVPDFVWGRLLSNSNKRFLNFLERIASDSRLFFRGHDHLCSLAISYENRVAKPTFSVRGKYKIDLEKARTIASLGAFYDGEYAIYDNQKAELDFKSWSFKENKPVDVL